MAVLDHPEVGIPDFPEYIFRGFNVGLADFQVLTFYPSFLSLIGEWNKFSDWGRRAFLSPFRDSRHRFRVLIKQQSQLMAGCCNVARVGLFAYRCGSLFARLIGSGGSRFGNHCTLYAKAKTACFGIGINGDSLVDGTNVIRVVSYLDDVVLAGQDGFLGPGRSGASAGCDRFLEDQRFLPRIGEFELAAAVCSLDDGAVIMHQFIKRNFRGVRIGCGLFSCILCIYCKRCKKDEQK